MKLVDLTVKEFLSELASSSPAPGGGSVSALAGANGCSLFAMVGNLTIGKKKFKALSEDIQNEYKTTLSYFENNISAFTELIDLDTEAFNKLMTAFQLPKENDNDIAIRNKEIDKATLGCIKVPLKVAILALETLRKVESMIEYSNKNTVSDQGVSVLMLYSAINGALMNVLINLPGIGDETLKSEFRETTKAILKESDELRQSLLDKIQTLLQ
ncbi:MAG: cyclodeaminase/cyclohydrolase family protein [Candidatus Izemoplasmatales bacterium]|jgi:formiminotetrahydrofolate cyclodeaminase|nr:cyclodeaminase/cyclohydrolase family protein [Candidatus Izemoplasmatales bacterium]